MKKLILIIALALFSMTSYAQGSEEILGFNVDGSGIEYSVYSGGCTSKEDFKVTQSQTKLVQIELVRQKSDDCEALLPYGAKIKFTWEEIGIKDGSQIVIVNPIASINVYSF